MTGKRPLCLIVGVSAVLGLFTILMGQDKAADPGRLTLDRIFNSREFASERFGPARWMSDGSTYTTLESSAEAKGGRDLVLYRADTGRREVLVSAAKLVPSGASGPLSIENYAWSPDGKVLIVFTNSKRVWRQNTRGDFWTYELASGRLRQLGSGFDPSSLMFAKLSPDGLKAAYVVKNNLYAEDLASGRTTQLTFDGGEDIINGTSDWVNEEEFSIRDGFRWSPDSRSIAFWRFDTHDVPVFTMINNTDTLYPKVTTFKHPKPGQVNSAVTVGVVPVAGGAPVWLKTPGDPRDGYIARLEWAGNSREVILQHLNRLQNTLSVFIGDAATGEIRTVFTDRDEAWVEIMEDFVWLDGGRSLLWLSERDGWQHAYRVSRDGRDVKLLTPGDYDVLSLEAVDEGGGWLYVTASPAEATKRFLFRVRLDGKSAPELVGPAGQTGVHRYDISPSGRWAFHTFGGLDTPPVTELVRLPDGGTVRTLAANEVLKANVEALRRKRVEFFKLDIGDGVQVDGWRILPPDFDPAGKYPLFVYVYGEPAGQTVQDNWGGNGYLWHLMLAQQGYIVASFDNHGTPAPRGRAWRKSIYRQIGILASRDQAAAVRAALAAWPFVDAGRVGVWGWSGGGSMTLNAMFRYPDLYKTGISVASVPDQRLYDTIYQERYMGLPDDNVEGYAQGSPITFAKDLLGRLLIVHGTGDDNVHYQGFERLINELVANDKAFTMMAYPNRSHGISEGRGTTLHLYTLFTRFLNENLPPGDRAR
ncbi:MAG: S9 family peptidase [Candidatus Aminicenantes bacterium]|nr:S9 family peptidase [Candidatus Aminicenantes bacterium]